MISPLEAISEETAHEIFSLFTEAIGFYILLNCYLQVIVPDDFNYEDALSTLPHEFGGLKVSFIRHSLYPTADNPERSSTSAPVTQQSSNSGTGTTIGTTPGTGANDGAAFSSMAISKRVGLPVEDRSATTRFKRTLGSSVRVAVPGFKSKGRYEGKVGVLVSPKDQENKVYATVPTHIFTEAASASKLVSLESKDWVGVVWSQMARTSIDLGGLFQVFDSSPQAFPIGFTHDTSLVDVSHVPSAIRAGGSSTIERLDHHDWMSIKYNSSDLVLLDGDGEPREAKSIAVTDSRCQIVGQGIFRIHQETKPRRSFLRSVAVSSSSASDARDELSTWTTLVARSILYRVRYDSGMRGGQSGTLVCVLRPSQAGELSNTRTAKVVGFASFVQMVSDVQRYEMEGDKLYKRLQEGRVAFYGAFQLPKELTEGYHIV